MYILEQLENLITNEELQNIRNMLKNSSWNYKMPGGFLTNFPQRRVNTYGNGMYINESGKLEGHKWDKTFWTAKQTQNNVSLETNTCEIPKELCVIIPRLRNYLKEKMPNNTIDINSFNIAVCNNYTDPNMNIAGHTDDDYWYPKEVNERPVFASLTFYLDGKPAHDKYYSRFQIKINDKWTDIKLDDNSIMYMNSDIPHRVLKHKKKDKEHFRPRINITLRSTFKIEKNPLLHNICVANHTRYYRNPSAIVSSGLLSNTKIDDLLDKYNEFCKNNNHTLIVHKINKEHEKKYKYIEKYKRFIVNNNLSNIYAYKSNMVTETLIEVCNYLENQ